ncbi:MAG: ADP-ribosylglycohydrolase family protein [Fimbriimonadaceae bacterium]|nr:ADP-ribosylglycohydrolase family protein [Fimbriimonadaceae bacterium]
MNSALADRLRGLLLGQALGDALGLPYEGLPPGRIARRLAGGPLRHAVCLGRGMVSDDTEHACLVAQALLRQPADPTAFGGALAWGLRGWFAALPAGCGLATLRACLRLWVGLGPQRAGVWSAGNGPAMRAPLLGAVLAGRADLADYLTVSTRLTHTDPQATSAALALAAATAALGSGGDPAAVLAAAAAPADECLRGLLAAVGELLASGAPDVAILDRLATPRGVSGYIHHTVAAAIWCCLRHPGDFRSAVTAAVRLGGDTDTVAAITGALAGVSVGEAGLPADWLAGLWEWPRGVAWMQAAADRLAAVAAGAASPGPLELAWWAIPPRNALFLGAVLTHGLRRLLPG